MFVIQNVDIIINLLIFQFFNIVCCFKFIHSFHTNLIDILVLYLLACGIK